MNQAAPRVAHGGQLSVQRIVVSFWRLTVEAARFDRMSRALFSQPSRRGMLAILAGSLLAPLPRGLGVEDAEARRRKKKKKRCKGGTKRCGKQCRNLLTDSANCGACGNTCGKFPCFNGACGCERIGCPPGCNCVARKEGGSACAGGASATPCDTDSDCPARSFCVVTNVCSAPCLGQS